jgi:hypothetical protein
MASVLVGFLQRTDGAAAGISFGDKDVTASIEVES